MWIMDNVVIRLLFVCVIAMQDTPQPVAEDCRYLAKNVDDFTSPWRSSCLLFVSSKFAWRSALENCQTLGGSLVKVKDVETQIHIQTKLKFQSNKTGSWWIGPDPYFISDTYGCYMYDTNTTTWNGVDCLSEHRVICSIQPREATRCTLTNGKSFKHAVSFNGFCYFFFERKRKWSEANADCVLQTGGTLTDIMDNETTNFINLYRHKNDLDAHDAWIGLHRVDSEYKWITGRTLTYTNWGYDEPSYVGEYVVVSARTGKWDNMYSKWPLYTYKYQYICKAGISPSTTVTSQTYPSTKRVTKQILERQTKDYTTGTSLSTTQPYSSTDSTPFTTHVPPEDELVPEDITPTLSVAAVAGIVVAVILGVAVAVIIGVIITRKRSSNSKNNPAQNSAVENTIYYSAPWDNITIEESSQRHSQNNHLESVDVENIALDESCHTDSKTRHYLVPVYEQPSIESVYEQPSIESAHHKVDQDIVNSSCSKDIHNHSDNTSHGLHESESNTYTNFTADSEIEIYNHLGDKPQGHSHSSKDETYNKIFHTNSPHVQMAAHAHMTNNSEETYDHFDTKPIDHSTNIYDHTISNSQINDSGSSYQENDYDHVDVDHSRCATPEDTYDNAVEIQMGDVYANSTSEMNCGSQDMDIYDQAV